MEIWTYIENFVCGGVPQWVELALPVLLIPAAILLALMGGRRFYVWIAAVIGIFGFSLVCARGDLANAFLYLGLYALIAGVFASLLLIPSIKTRKGKKSEDRLYEKFHVELRERPFGAPPQKPPKVCCFEEEGTASAEESGLRLEHVGEMLRRLRAAQKLSPTDRLEADSLARTLDNFREKRLTSAELNTLNDCLSTVLKLTAKYQL